MSEKVPPHVRAVALPLAVSVSAAETDVGVKLPVEFSSPDISHVAAGRFERYREDDPRVVTGLRVTALAECEPSHIGLGAFRSTRYLADGRVESGPQTLMLVQTPEDQVGLALETTKSGKPALVVTTAVSPALLARSARDLPTLAGMETGMFTGLPSGYRRAGSANDTLQAVAAHKVGQRVDEYSIHPLGTAFLPCPQDCPALFLPMRASSKAAELGGLVCFGNGFDGMQLAEVMPLQDIVDDFAKGKVHDARLLEVVFRLAEESGQQLRLPTFVQQRIVAMVEDGRLNSAARILDSDAVKAILAGRGDEAGLTNFMSLTAVARPQGEDAALKAYSVEVQNLGSSGEALGEPYQAEAALRDRDNLSVGLFTLMDGRPYLVVRFACYEALEFRDQAPRYAHLSTSARCLEGVCVPIDAKDGTAYYDPALVSAAVEQQTGKRPSVTPFVFPGYSLASPEFIPNATVQALAFLPAAESAYLRDCVLVEPRVVLELAREGYVRNLALLQSARLVEAAFPVEARSTISTSRRSPHWHQFVDLMGSDSSLHRFICEYAPGVREVVRNSPAFLKLLNLRENMGGIQIERPRPEDPEALFFSSNLEVYNVHAGMPALEVAQLLVHDLWHFKERDQIPYTLDQTGNLARDPNGAVRVCSVESQNRSLSKNETDALMFSEVEFVEAVGIDVFERETGKGSVAGLLREAGVLGLEAQHAVVAEMVQHGRVPESVARVIADPQRFGWYREALYGRLIGIHVRDVDNGIKSIHEAWMQMPEVAEAALRMGGIAYDNTAPIDESYQVKRDRLLAQAVGVNPLLSQISHARTHDAYGLGLKVAYLRGLMLQNSIALDHPEMQCALALQQRCESGYFALSELLGQVTSTDCTEANFEAYKKLRDIEQSLEGEVAGFVRRVSEDANLVGSDAAHVLKDRRHFPFALVPYAVPEKNRERVAEILKSELEQYGLTAPNI
ncbi:MAG: hypothetical protein K1X79_02900 [Oligoflexia bacterium]|nr:hypothetical protein [Oligoflexia bacterium]